MGFFEDEEVADLRDAEVDPFAIPVGTTPVYVEKSEVLDHKGEKVWVITFREAREVNGKPSFKRHTEWLRHPRYVQEESKKNWRRGKIKQVLTALGIPATRLNEANPEDVLGIQGNLRLYEKNGFKQFGKFDKTESGSAGDGLVSGTPDIGDLNMLAGAGANDYFN